MTTPRMNPAIARVNYANPLARQQARQREQAQSQPRPSRIRMTVKVTGVGETRLKVVFSAYMVDEPTFSFGCIAAVPLQFGELPLATATVISWEKNHAGMYSGAIVGFKVDSSKFNMILDFSLTFEASALRSMSLG